MGTYARTHAQWPEPADFNLALCNALDVHRCLRNKNITTCLQHSVHVVCVWGTDAILVGLARGCGCGGCRRQRMHARTHAHGAARAGQGFSDWASGSNMLHLQLFSRAKRLRWSCFQGHATEVEGLEVRGREPGLGLGVLVAWWCQGQPGDVGGGEVGLGCVFVP